MHAVIQGRAAKWLRTIAVFVMLLGSALLPATSAWAVDFSLKDMQGKAFNLADEKGKFVVVNFWATWCPPCREEIPELIRFHDVHKNKDAVVWGVNYEKAGNPAMLAQFVDDQMIDYPVLPMSPMQPNPFGPIRGLPTTVLVAPDGSIARTHLGGITGKVIEGYMRDWCQTNPAGKEMKACR
jgi:thiol-disulfide isomerase/thioredoxin